MTRQIDILINVRTSGTSSLNGLGQKLTDASGGATKGAKGFDLAGKALSGLGKLAAGFTMAAAAGEIARFANESVQAFSQFDKGVREIFTLLPGVTDAAKREIEAQVLDMSAAIGRTSGEVTTALYESLAANVPADNVFEFLKVASDAAKGGVTDLNVVVDGLTSVINSYGLEVADATQVSDILFQTVKFGKVRFSELATNLSTVVPVAAALGIPLEEIGALLATITAQGTNTGVAATQIRSALLDLSKGGGVAAEAFKRLSGQSFQDFIASGGTVQEAMMVLAAEADRTGVNLTDFFGRIEGGQAALQATGRAAELYNSIFAEVTNSTGSTAAAAGEFAGSLASQQAVLDSTTEKLKVLVGQALAPAKEAFIGLKLAIVEGAVAIAASGNTTEIIMGQIAEAAIDPQDEMKKLAAAYLEAQAAIDDAPLVGLTEALGFTNIADDLQQQLKDLTLAGIELETGLTQPALRADELYTALRRVYGSSVEMEAGVISVNGAVLGFATDLYATAEAAQLAADAQRRAASEQQDTANRAARASQYSAEARQAALAVEINAANESFDAAKLNALGLNQVADAQAIVAAGADDMADAVDGGAEAMTLAAQAAIDRAAMLQLAAAGERELTYTTQASVTAGKLAAEATIEQADADRIAGEALDEHTRKIAGYYTAALQARDGTGFFNESLADLGTSTVYSSNLTAEQSAQLGALRAEYDKVTGKLYEYQIGTEGILLSEEERAEKMGELATQAAALESAMQPLNDVGGEYSQVTTEATINTGAVSNALLDAALASGANRDEMALLGVTLGVVSQEQAEAALKAAILQEKLDGIAKAFAGDKITAEQAAKAMQDAITEVQNLDLAIDPATNSVYDIATAHTNLALQAEEAGDRVGDLTTKLFGIPPTTEASVTVNTSEAEGRLSSLEARLLQLGSGGAPGTASGGYQNGPDLPGRAAGGPVVTGQTYNVGERTGGGAEMYQSPNYNQLLNGGLFTPPENGQIIPAGRANQYNNTANFNISGAADLATLTWAYMLMGRQHRRL